MRKKIVPSAQQETSSPDESWLDLERLVQVEITSEEDAHPIESALQLDGGEGWRAAEPGEQTVRLLFSDPQRIRRIRLRFVEPVRERTQEFVLRWSSDSGRPLREIVRQQWNFSPGGATTETEDIRVDLAGVRVLELSVVPDIGKGDALASLAEWRLA